MPTVTRLKVRDAIAEALWAKVSAYDLAEVCVYLGLDPPHDEHDSPMASKRSYVNARTQQMSMPALVDLARRLSDEGYGHEGLDEVLAQLGGHGVDGELKNIIFAADGPKPEIVLRDALNNVIEITKHEEHCLVYDRPLPESGLSWRELVSWWWQTRHRGAVDERLAALIALQPTGRLTGRQQRRAHNLPHLLQPLRDRRRLRPPGAPAAGVPSLRPVLAAPIRGPSRASAAPAHGLPPPTPPTSAGGSRGRRGAALRHVGPTCRPEALRRHGV